MVAELKGSPEAPRPYYNQFVKDILKFDTGCLEKYKTLLEEGMTMILGVDSTNYSWTRLGSALAQLGINNNPFLIRAFDEVRSVLKTIDSEKRVDASTVISMCVFMFTLDYGDTHWSDDFKENSKIIRKQLNEVNYLVGSDVANILGFGQNDY